MADLNPVVGSEQGGIRPVVILQNDIGNHHSPTTIVAAITSRRKTKLPTHAAVHMCGHLNTVLLEQIRTISRDRLLYYMGSLRNSDLSQVEEALRVSLNLSTT